MCKKILDHKLIALTLYKRGAYETVLNPISQTERWGFIFLLIAIRYLNN